MLGPSSAETRRVSLFTIALASGMFALLAVMVATGAADAFDSSVRADVRRWSSPELTAAIRVVTHLGSVAVLLALCAAAALALYLLGKRRVALSLALTLIGTMLVNTALKLAFHRERPEPFYGDILGSFSFPSGHSAFACCFYLGVATIAAAYARTTLQRVAISFAAAVLIAAIGFSRVYLGVHYPTDVLGGYLVAVACVATARAIGK